MSDRGYPSTPDEPDTTRVPTEADRVLAGLLSTVWPMTMRHPADCLHLAILVHDRIEAGDLP